MQPPVQELGTHTLALIIQAAAHSACNSALRQYYCALGSEKFKSLALTRPKDSALRPKHQQLRINNNTEDMLSDDR